MSWIVRDTLLFLLMAVVKCNYYERHADLGFYKVYHTPATWSDALKTCLNDGATFFVPSSLKEKEKVVGLLRKVLPSNVIDGNGIAFVGYHNLFIEDYLDTPNGETFPVLNPENHEDIFSNRSEDTDHCGAIYSDGTMTLKPCNKKFPFVCEKPLWMSYELASNENYYKLYTDAATWPKALRTCEKDGAHLAIVTSSSEASILGAMIERYKTFPTAENNNFVAVGAHDLFKTGELRTVLGHKVELGILSEDGVRLENANCIYIKRDSNELFYGDCNQKFAFICEHGREIKTVKTTMTQSECYSKYGHYG